MERVVFTIPRTEISLARDRLFLPSLTSLSVLKAIYGVGKGCAKFSRNLLTIWVQSSLKNLSNGLRYTVIPVRGPSGVVLF